MDANDDQNDQLPPGGHGGGGVRFRLDGLEDGDPFYFVHAYYPDPVGSEHVFATTDYGGEFCCALGRDNVFATQFHPEKSGRLGLAMLERFARWDGTC